MGGKVIFKRPKVEEALRLKPKWPVKLKKELQDKSSQFRYADANPGLASTRLRKRMVGRLRERGISDEVVLNAFEKVERHRFVDSALASRAYEDTALPIGLGQTISQPYVTARVLSLVRSLLGLALGKNQTIARQNIKILEIGTGCGYQAAIMSYCFELVFTVERIESLYLEARERCAKLGNISNLECHFADGSHGLPIKAPFDAIVFSAALNKFPRKLLSQIRCGGVIICPVGSLKQNLFAGVKSRDIKTKVNFFKFDCVKYVPVVVGLESFSK
ncbi:MAG: protein-L-isoaspartate O-methyltransferase [Betaproteobacteria bacterium TMED82]|nr:MAG: protein-L-isoaspartate O-methyltransferase [Betaproteobacteria bacterium TMED82]|tara:strand:+ start:87426 stop:88250 length:825 start_codon:yes stop_codon:yes gene_type:complete